MITLLVHLKAANQEDASELKIILQELTKSTPKEKGCLKYNIYQESDNPLSFQILESWNSKADLDRHQQLLIDSGVLAKASVVITGGLDQKKIVEIQTKN